MQMTTRSIATTAFVGALTVFAGAAHSQTTKPMHLGGSGDVTIYRDANYSGPAVSASRARPNLGLSWRINSVRISGGTWELCSRPNFEGICSRYSSNSPRLATSRRRVQSMRPVYDSGWELIGEQEVRDRTERDEIFSWGHTTHRRLRVCVEGHAVRFYDLAVIFFRDGHQDIPVRALIPAGQCTRDVILDGGARDVSMVKMTYETFSLGHGRATVQVYAQR